MRAADKEKIAVEVTGRVLSRVLARASKSREAYLDNLINEVFYFESKRLEHHRTAVNRAEDLQWLNRAKSQYKNASEKDKRDIVENIIERHVREITGHFSEPVYQFTTRVAPVGLGILLNAMSPLKLINSFPQMPDVSNHIVIEGEAEQTRRLEELGTVILTPTHSSNLDSLVVGYSLFNAGLPPYTYGAGINLFEHKMIGFFMHRLGAYKVDRLKKHAIYKDILKEYATITLELGYDNLFFPGGTRSRSGAVERKLKLGLLGTGLNAYYNNLVNKVEKPNVYIVPCTINYQIVLEAETLIEDHLKEAGKNRFIITDDEFSMPSKILSFMKNIVSLDADIHIIFGRAFDPFGNDVDDQGRSIDGRGREIDISNYLKRGNRLVEDANRDMVYTRTLGNRIVESFMAETVIYSNHILAWTVFEAARKKYPDPDFYRFLREAGDRISIPVIEVYELVGKLMKRLTKMADDGLLRLPDRVYSAEPREIVDRALSIFDSYHTHPAVERRGDRIFPTDMNLLYFYRNRLWGYGLEE